jgi:colanic acid biosynthesis protein WcaH
MMLELNSFRSIIENVPLVSIDICLVCDGKILLGKRNNQPLKGQWFTPGGRIFKNESWQECMLRVAKTELGLVIEDLPNYTLMGIWDHFYENSVMDEKVSTHYVNLPHYCLLAERPKLSVDVQHEAFSWFGLDEIVSARSGSFHEYIQCYASWLINMGIKND